MPTPTTDYTSAEAWCIGELTGDYGAEDIKWDQTKHSLCAYGPLYLDPSSGTGAYDNFNLLPREEINGGLGINYAEVIAACDRSHRTDEDYEYSDAEWAVINRSICTWPPEDEETASGHKIWQGETNLYDFHSVALTPLSDIEGRYIELDGGTDLSPWNNTLLTFSVETGEGHIDPETGNYEPILEELTYRAYLNIQQPDYGEKPGVDVTTYKVNGRLLNPATLDQRIQNGAQAKAIVNNAKGRFEFRVPLNTPNFLQPMLRQQLTGLFHLVGGPK